eukprot:249121-Chlamydomonas_euryale.AAC.1
MRGGARPRGARPARRGAAPFPLLCCMQLRIRRRHTNVLLLRLFVLLWLFVLLRLLLLLLLLPLLLLPSRVNGAGRTGVRTLQPARAAALGGRCVLERAARARPRQQAAWDAALCCAQQRGAAGRAAARRARGGGRGDCEGGGGRGGTRGRGRQGGRDAWCGSGGGGGGGSLGLRSHVADAAPPGSRRTATAAGGSAGAPGAVRCLCCLQGAGCRPVVRRRAASASACLRRGRHRRTRSRLSRFIPGAARARHAARLFRCRTAACSRPPLALRGRRPCCCSRMLGCLTASTPHLRNEAHTCSECEEEGGGGHLRSAAKQPWQP